MNIFPPTSESHSLQDHRDAAPGPQAGVITPNIYAHPRLLYSDNQKACHIFAQREEGDSPTEPAPKRRRRASNDCPTQSVSRALRALRKPTQQRDSPTPSQTNSASIATPVPGDAWTQQADVSPSAGKSLLQLPTSPYSKFRSYQRRPVVQDNEGVQDLQVETSFRECEAPKSAPRLSWESGPAAYCPWTGSHPEDVLSNDTITKGYQNKEANYPEHGTSRSTIFKQIKQPSDLQILSAFLSSVIQSRQNTRVKSCPVHERPRRLALTDTKREAWLRELADSNVPMRKLRRNIPNGICARALFDQCLAKLIPLERAIWLAKTISGNEILGSRRASHTARHSHDIDIILMREWTSSAHQFLETVLTAPINESSHQRTVYAIQMCARLLSEKLIDRDLAADLYLQFLEESPVETLPLRSLFLIPLMPYLTCCRDKAKRLASCFIDKHENICHWPAIYRHSIDNMHRFLRHWTKHGASGSSVPYEWLAENKIFSSCSGNGCTVDCIIPDFLSRKTKGLVPKSPMEHSHNLTMHVMQILDASPLDIPALLNICQQYSEDRNTLATILLKWASSTVRTGTVRTHVVASVLRKWAHANIDLNDLMTAVLPTMPSHSCLARSGICHVISELVRSHSISISDYLTWILARHFNSDNFCAQAPLEIEILVNIPSSALPRFVWNLRNKVLAKFGFTVSEERQNIDRVRNYVRHRMPSLFGVIEADNSQEPGGSIDLRSQSRTVKTNVAVWLRDTFCGKGPKSVPPHGTDHGSQTSAFTVSELLEVRSVLEQLEDLPMLADVLEHVSLSQDSKLLTVGLKTLSYHLKSFLAIGVASELFAKLSSGIAELLDSEGSSCDFLGPYLSIAAELSIDQSMLPFFREISSGIRSSLENTCFNEPHISSFDTINSPSWYEVKDSFRTPVDSPTVNTLLDRLCTQSVSSVFAIGHDEERILYTVYNLRLSNPKHFDQSVKEWMLRDLSSPTNSRIFCALPVLVSLGVVTLPSFFALVKKVYAAEKVQWSSVDVSCFLQSSLLVLTHDMKAPPVFNDALAYSFEKSRQEFLESNAENVLSFLDLAYTHPAIFSDSEGRLTYENVVNLVYELLLRSPSSVRTVFETFSSGQMITSTAIGQLLGCQNTEGLGAVKETIEKLETFTAELCSKRAKFLIEHEKDDRARHSMEEVLLRAFLRREYTGASPKIDFFYHIPEEDLEPMSCRVLEHALFLVINSNMIATGLVQTAHLNDMLNRGDSKDFINFYLDIGARDASHNPSKSLWSTYHRDSQTAPTSHDSNNSAVTFDNLNFLNTWSRYAA
ncbi:hypothetical protein KEM56_004829, partial [Ascosphaera pollenicola]